MASSDVSPRTCTPPRRHLFSPLLAVLLVVCVVGATGLRGSVGTSDQTPAAHSSRLVVPFDDDWRFSRGDFATAMMPGFDDRDWQHVVLPHDWSAEGPFSAEWASGNGYAPGGVAWYRKHVVLPPDVAGKTAVIEFDGVYDHSEVWVNGHLVGGRPYGYSSFECTLSPYLTGAGQDNLVAVRVDHSRFSDSRWYTGSGIYRHVRLRFTGSLHLGKWGTFVMTPVVGADRATVRVETTVENQSDDLRACALETEVLADDSRIASSTTDLSVPAGASRTIVQTLSIERPRLWSPASPTLYLLRQTLREGAGVADETRTPFGIRAIRFDPDRGFLLNGEVVKIKGVCLHHDAGPLGAAVPEGVWDRRLRTLKDLGVNAIRTSHNPPAPELLDLCDRLGLLVMDEAFDEFTPSKNKWVNGWNVGVPSRFGYGESFAAWSVTDVSDLVRRDRNHPSVVLWSIGNEIDYPNDPFSDPVLGKAYRPQNPPASDLVRWGRPLADAVRRLDPTRPVTAALASVAMSDAAGFSRLLDVVGYNYQESRYATDHARNAHRVLIGSENNHQYANWTVVRDNPYVAGQFLWTGIDYLGEARVFPNRANGAGLLDLCGFRKPMAWFRQSLWGDAPMVYLAASPATSAGPRGQRVEEHWNWPEGSTVKVSCYTNCDEVTLALNGSTLATRRRSEAVDGVLTWEMPYRAGSLDAVGRSGGKAVATFTLRTAGPARRIALLADVAQLSARRDLCHVEFRIVDEAGVQVPDAAPQVTFTIEGPGRLLAIGNADLNSTEDCLDPVHHAYRGRGLAILEGTGAQGTIVLTAASPGLEPARLVIPASR